MMKITGIEDRSLVVTRSDALTGATIGDPQKVEPGSDFDLNLEENQSVTIRLDPTTRTEEEGEARRRAAEREEKASRRKQAAEE